MRMPRTSALVFALAVLAWPLPAPAHDASHHAVQDARLPVIGPAPDFTLTSQDGARVSLRDYRGKVLAVTFIFTSCADTCPLLTDKMARVQDELGVDFGARVAFASITVDPERDTPEVLKQYAEAFGANPAGWAFLTGTPEGIREVTRRYGVFVSNAVDGDVDHTFLTSLIDPRGMLRVQYLGVRFDPEEFRRDLLSLLDKPE
jgi:protein SCO1/2